MMRIWALATVAGAALLSNVAMADESGAAKATAQAETVHDPIEGVNRVIFDVNTFVDRYTLRPAAVVYRAVVPEPARDGIRNALDNLDSPVVFANDLLQGDFDRAGATMARFMINTTVGFGGIFDVASEVGVPDHDEDFGQTLGVWGLGEGPYLVLPLLGPSNLRDLTGRVVDTGLDPLTYVDWEDANLEAFPYLRTGLGVLDGRSRNIETLDNLEQTSVDYYAAIRSAYTQRRRDEIANGQPRLDDLPDIE
jgi:phospholipid-binding lipoprotein MlaA